MLPHWTQNDITVDGAPLHYYRTGDAGKPALVLAHGFSDDGLCWLQTALDLEAEFDVVMPDARGHGLSARLRPGEVRDPAADLAAVMQALGLPRAVVAGHSMGAATAYQLGVRCPQLVRALILEDPPWFRQPPASALPLQERGNPMQDWVNTIQRQTLDEIIAQCWEEHPTWHEMVVQTWCSAKKRLDYSFLSTMGGSMFKWEESITSIAFPVLLVTADADLGGIVTPELAQWVIAQNPNFRLAHVPGVGHHVRFGDYATYMQAVRNFLAEIKDSPI